MTIKQIKNKHMKRLSILILFFIAFTACKTEKAYVPENKIKEDVTFLADDKLEGRGTGTEGEKMAAEYIAKRFKEMGIAPKGTDGYLQTFTFKPKKNPHEKATFTETSSDSTVTGTNIVGYIDNNASKTIVIGAHYDHLGYGGEGSLKRLDQIVCK